MSSASNRPNPLDMLRDTASRFRRKADGSPSPMLRMIARYSYTWSIRLAIYQHEADRLDDLISLCDGTGTSNASADTLPVAATENTDGVGNEQT